MPKPPSQRASARKPIDPEKVEHLVAELVDRPHGGGGLPQQPEPEASTAKQSQHINESANEKASVKNVGIGISLPPAMIEQLEDTAFKNKRSKQGPRTVSGLIQEALKAAGYGVNGRDS